MKDFEAYQRHSTKVDGPLNTLTVITSDHTPSWKTGGKPGSARFESRTHAEAKHVSIRLLECGGEGPRRETMMTIYPEAAQALYEQLALIFRET